MKDYKYEKLKNILTEKIRDYSWTAGTKILSERELALRYDVSRITARRAVEDLVSDGYLEHIPGKRGTFVTHRKDEAELSDLMGVAIDQSTANYDENMLQGIEDCLWKYKKHTVYCNTYQNIRRVEEYFDSLASRPIDGFIFSPVIDEHYIEKNMAFLKQMEEKGIPYILVDRYIPGVSSSYVITNNRESAYRMTEAVLDRGHRRIALLTGILCTSMRERIEGVDDCLRDKGVEIPSRNRLSINDLSIRDRTIDTMNKEDRVLLMKEQLESLGDFSAVIALNTPLLRLADEAVGLMRLKQKIEAACYDSLPDNFKNLKQVMRVVQPFYQMGYEGAKTLMELKSDRSGITIKKVIPSDLELFD